MPRGKITPRWGYGAYLNAMRFVAMGARIKKSLTNLTRRERQIMDAVHRLGEAGVAEVRRELPEPPSYSAVRTMIRLLESKGHLRHRRDGVRYVYRATQPVEQVRMSALRHLVHTLFAGCASEAMAALLELDADTLSEADLDRLARMIDDAKKNREG
jgi:predicted transcriptional regulator